MKLVKGSAAAKAYMAKIRSAKGKTKKATTGKKMYVYTDGISKKLVSNKKDATKLFYVQASYMKKFYTGAKLIKLNNREGQYILEVINTQINGTKTLGSFQTTYSKAPVDVKKIIDNLDPAADYRLLIKAQKLLSSKGYFIDYDLNGEIINFKKIDSSKINKIGEVYYFGDGKKVKLSELKIGNIYEWIGGAEYLEIKYIGLSRMNPEKKAGVTYGNGGYLFQFTDDNKYVNLSGTAIITYVRTIPTNVGAYKKPVLFKPTKKQTEAAAKRLVKESTHKDTKSHNVNIRVVSGFNKFYKHKGFTIDVIALNNGKKEYAVYQVSPVTKKEVYYGSYLTLTAAKNWIDRSVYLLKNLSK